ncbi:MAG: hypothetical protein EBY39_02985 [Flavobacteriia bacterium]|nr:hypothetical protein [Flavobacteriia bacterium]
MKDNHSLTEDQKKFIQQNKNKITDLGEMTRAVFMNENIDGRSQQGRSVREYLIEIGQKFDTTKAAPAKEIILSNEDKEFISEYSSNGTNAYQIAKLIFPESNVTPLSKETIVIADYIREHIPQGISSEDSARGLEYNPPCTTLSAIKKVNTCAGVRLNIDKITRQENLCIEVIMKNLASPRFISQITSYTDINDRKLFEAEFVRACWDKPDLTPDEINMYINICMDYINLKQIEKQKLKLNDMFNSAEEETDLTMRLTEILKTKSEEYNQCINRIDRAITKLQGDRSKRLDKKNQNTASMLSLVKLFQEEEERAIMIKMAEMQKSLIKDEADRMEDMPAWKARILGISKSDAI